MVDRPADGPQLCVRGLIQKPGDAPDDLVPVHRPSFFRELTDFFVLPIELFRFVCYDTGRALQSPDQFMDQTKVVLVLLPQQIDDLYNDRILPKAHVYPASLVMFLIDPAASVAKLPPPGLAWADYSLSCF